jgi:hypothetical protein
MGDISGHAVDSIVPAMCFSQGPQKLANDPPPIGFWGVRLNISIEHLRGLRRLMGIDASCAPALGLRRLVGPQGGWKAHMEYGNYRNHYHQLE